MPSLKKAYLKTEKKDEIPLLFNPSKLSFKKSNDWSDAKPGQNAPELIFKTAGPGYFELDIFLDSTGAGRPVTQMTEKLQKLMERDPSLQGSDDERNKTRPPWVRFHWGRFQSFKAVVTALEVKYTFFASDGTPLRAECELKLKQYTDESLLPRQNPTSGTPTPHKVRAVQAGEYLDTMAVEVYGDSGHWRAIAAANDIADPFAVPPGRMLVIPRVED